ncbi:hypothetical protein [Loktanella atrilutea]|uniref:hypothetical protein n=1 Tax=Loktanella atrilutea TaxID=366533 RepID=UPI00116070E5
MNGSKGRELASARALVEDFAHRADVGGNRDVLVVGFHRTHVAAVWRGRPDGTPVPGAFGGDLAAPVLFNIFAVLPAVPLPPQPNGR